MAQTLSFGFIIPENGDPARVWQPAIVSSLTQLNSHNHDGVNSAQINPASITKLQTSIVSGAWVNDGNGNYSQVVNLPPAITEVNNYFIKIHNADNGDFLFLSIERVTAGSFRVRVNDNTLNLVATYL